MAKRNRDAIFEEVKLKEVLSGQSQDLTYEGNIIYDNSNPLHRFVIAAGGGRSLNL